MNRLERIRRSLTKKAVPSFEIGDTVRVHVKVVEGEKERIQIFEGAPVCMRKEGERITFYGHMERGAEMAEAFLQRLKRSRDTRERVASLVRSHLRHTQAPAMRLSTLKRFLGADGIGELLELTRIDALAANGDLTYYDFCKAKLAELREEEIHPEPLVRGRDLIALGLTPGPVFGQILAQVEEAQLGGELHNHEEAIAWIRKHFTDRG